jgi:hypothetical protein
MKFDTDDLTCEKSGRDARYARIVTCFGTVYKFKTMFSTLPTQSNPLFSTGKSSSVDLHFPEKLISWGVYKDSGSILILLTCVSTCRAGREHDHDRLAHDP